MNLERCPCCDGGELVAVVGFGTWDAEGCPKCHATWWFQWPRHVDEIPVGMRQMTLERVKGETA